MWVITNHNKTWQRVNHIHISWDVLCVILGFFHSLRPGDAYMRHEKWLSFPEWRIYASELLYTSFNARESLAKQLSVSMSCLNETPHDFSKLLFCKMSSKLLLKLWRDLSGDYPLKSHVWWWPDAHTPSPGPHIKHGISTSTEIDCVNC